MQYLNTRQVASMLAVSPRTITRWCLAGEFDGAFITSDSGSWRIPNSAVESFVKKRTRNKGDNNG